MNRYHQALAASNVSEDDALVSAAVAKIIEKAPEYAGEEVYKLLFSCIDLTTLSTEDSQNSVAAFTRRVNSFDDEYPQYLDVSGVNVAVVAGGFPSGQTFTEVKIADAALAVANGADEVDVVMNVGMLLDEDYEDLCDELIELKHTIKDARLKVILETGALKSAAMIKKASILAMYSDADFIKTSTGKIYPGANLEAAYVMCSCIKEYFEATGRRVGFKAAGGVRTPEQALQYYAVVKEVLGDEWLTPEFFRIGASGLANNLLTVMTGAETKFF